MSEQIKCACPNECTENWNYCKVNYDFILSQPIVLTCGHCICSNCENRNIQNLNCVFCKLNNNDTKIEIDNNISPAITELFNSVLDNSIISCRLL